MKAQLQSPEWDVVISDFNLPGFNAYAALKVLQGKRAPDSRASCCPVRSPTRSSTAFMKAGASQYLCKYEIRQIVPTIEQAMQTSSE